MRRRLRALEPIDPELAAVVRAGLDAADREAVRRREERAALRAAAPAMIADPATRQTCRRCGRALPLEAFTRNRRMLLGRELRCRECLRVLRRERRASRE